MKLLKYATVVFYSIIVVGIIIELMVSRMMVDVRSYESNNQLIQAEEVMRYVVVFQQAQSIILLIGGVFVIGTILHTLKKK